jgi:Reverse transcriptase (RNA-dependent DNA polymerase)
MENNKSPGPDGLGIELYKTFPSLTKALAQTFIATDESISSKLNHGNIILLHKSGPKDNISNYRPLTMLNTDYKIIAKMLTSRLQAVIQHIVHPDQTGFIKGRSIKHNILQSILIQQYNKDPYAAFLLLDLTKAFDRVSHE